MSRKTETKYIRAHTEKSKAPKKSHGKLARAMEIVKDTTTNPHAKQKKANVNNPHGKSHKPKPKS